jgi:hypothetical protein
MTHEDILRLLGYTLDTATTFGPAFALGLIAWRIAR